MKHTNTNKRLIEARNICSCHVSGKLYGSKCDSNGGKGGLWGFTITKGLIRKRCLPPKHLIIYFEQGLKIGKPFKVENCVVENRMTLDTLCFTYDRIVVAQDHEYLNYIARKMNEEYTNWEKQNAYLQER